MLSELQQCRVFVNPSLHTGGYETTQIEAMACGKLVVTPNAGANGMVVSPRITGFMFRIGNVKSLSKALVKALKVHTDQRERMCAAAREKATRDFSINKMAEMTETALVKIKESFDRDVQQYR